MRPEDETFLKLEQEFKAEHRPDSTGSLDALRPAIIRFYLDGYSKGLTFKFLASTGVISCSRATFFRWIARNMNLEADARAFLAASAPRPQTAAGESTHPISHAKFDAPEAAPMGSRGAEPAKSPSSVGLMPVADVMSESISHVKSGGAELSESHATTEAQVRAMPAETAQQENALTAVASKTNVASPRPSQDQSDSTLSTTQQTSVKSTQGKAPISEEKRRQLVEFLRQQTSELERNDMGATADRALARLNRRDMENGGRDG